MIETLTPNSRAEWLDLRKSTIGASEIAALLGRHPWLTPYKLFALKTGQYVENKPVTKILENSIHMPPLERGNFMEDKAFDAFRMLRPHWMLTPNTIPCGMMFVDRETGISSTPDAFLIDPNRPGTQGTIQIKTVAPMAFDKDWKNEDGEIEFPVYVGVQAIVDAMLSSCDWACAGALVNNFGVDFYLISVPLKVSLMARIRKEAAEFWHRVRENDPYPPDYARDGDVIKSLYAYDDGVEIDLSGNERVAKLAARHIALKEIESAGRTAGKEREIIDPQIIEALGNASRGTLADGRVIEAKTTRRQGFVVNPTSYRSVKIKGNVNATSNRTNRGAGPQSATCTVAPEHF